jgi:phosphoribosylaminoimidazole-succinocarboxamide synthase
MQEIISNNLVSSRDYAVIEKYSLALFARGTAIARERGLILVDTKYEFGKVDDQIYLIDEIHTPDSSRYFYADGYELRQQKGETQKQLSKEFVREWLMANGFQGRDGQRIPQMTDDIVQSISDRYIELFEKMTGETFIRTNEEDILKRIEDNITGSLQSLNVTQV